MLRLWPIALSLVVLSGAVVYMSLQQPTQIAQPSSQTPTAQSSERNYTGTGLVQKIEALKGGACKVHLKLHEWTSMSTGFSLAEMPRAGNLYRVEADADNCLAIQVALSEGIQGESVKGHIYYTAGQREGGSWYFMTRPKAPVGCGVM